MGTERSLSEDDSCLAADAAAREQRRLMEREASRRRTAEASDNGLEIIWARYGDPALAVMEGHAGAGVIDVTDCLMAKVRSSKLFISDRPKSSLLGFCVPPVHECYREVEGPMSSVRARVLHVAYHYGGVAHAR